MKAGIDITGDLVIVVGSEIEAFALKSWADRFKVNKAALKLIVKPSGALWETDKAVIEIYQV